MADLKTYLDKRGITEEQMEEARRATQAYIDAFNSSSKERDCRPFNTPATTISIDKTTEAMLST